TGGHLGEGDTCRRVRLYRVGVVGAGVPVAVLPESVVAPAPDSSVRVNPAGEPRAHVQPHEGGGSADLDSRGVDSADRLDPQLPVAVATPAQGSTRRIQAARVLEGGMYLEKPVYLETERLRDGGRGAVGDGDVDGGYTDCEWGPGDFSVVVDTQ